MKSTKNAPAIVPGNMLGKVRTSRGIFQQLMAGAGLVVVFAVFAFANDNFRSVENIMNIVFSSVVIGIMALGATLVIITGGIDLSVGTGAFLCAIMAGRFLIVWDLPFGVGLLCTLAFGALMGAFSGTCVAIFRIPPFIATLAVMQAAMGMSMLMAPNKAPIYFSDLPQFTQLSQGKLIPGVWNAILVFALLVVVAWFLLNRTLLGRYDLAIGSNEEATALSGVNVRKWKIIIYAVAGIFTACAGIMVAARLGQARPGIGMGYELQAIAAVVIGGTSLAGGRGSMFGTLIGALIIAVLNNGLSIINVPQEWQSIILGAVILLAVYADMIRQRKSV